MSQPRPGWVEHGACGKFWCGTKTCHCSASGCHLTFTTITAFDKHRRGGKCLTPSEAGLVLTGREYECYGLPGKEEDA